MKNLLRGSLGITITLTFALTLAAPGCAPTDDDESGMHAVSETSEAQTESVCPASPHGKLKGIDVSRYQGDIDWQRVKKEGGIAWAYAKLNQGTLVDKKFAQNWRAMKAAGVVRGAYMFVYSKADRKPAKDIVALFAEQMKDAGGYDASDLPPVLDVEEQGGSDLDYVMELVQAMEDQLHRKPVFYAARSQAQTAAPEFHSLPLWIADINSTNCPKLPSGWGAGGAWTMWQWRFGEHGYDLPGIGAGGASDADADWFNGNLADLQAFIKASRM
jgi:lysozyme